MAAHADDLRYFYSESLGQTEEVVLSGVAARSARLSPGRYAVRVRSIVTAAALWLRQGDDTVTAATAAPSTPFSLNGTVGGAADAAAMNSPITFLMVREAKDGHISAVLDAGSAVLVITKVSRDKS